MFFFFVFVNIARFILVTFAALEIQNDIAAAAASALALSVLLLTKAADVAATHSTAVSKNSYEHT